MLCPLQLRNVGRLYHSYGLYTEACPFEVIPLCSLFRCSTLVSIISEVEMCVRCVCSPLKLYMSAGVYGGDLFSQFPVATFGRLHLQNSSRLALCPVLISLFTVEGRDALLRIYLYVFGISVLCCDFEKASFVHAHKIRCSTVQLLNQMWAPGHPA